MWRITGSSRRMVASAASAGMTARTTVRSPSNRMLALPCRRWCYETRYHSQQNHPHVRRNASLLTVITESPHRSNFSTSSSTSNENDNGDAKSIYLKACWNDFDLEEGDIVKATLSYSDIQEQAMDFFGRSDGLEFFDGDDWRPLTPNLVPELPSLLEALAAESSTSVLPPLAIRIASLYDEDYGTENDLIKLRKMTPEQMQQQQNLPSPDQMQLKDTIDLLHRRLLDEGFTRHEQHASEHEPALPLVHRTVTVDGLSTLTRDWILEQAAHDTSIRSVIVSQPRALRHMTEALHYPLFAPSASL